MRSDRTPLPHLSKLLLLRAERGNGMWRHVTWQWCVMTWQWCLPRILRILLRFPPLPMKCRKRNCNESLCPKRGTTPLHASARPLSSSMPPSEVSATHPLRSRHPCPSPHACPVTPFFPLAVPARPRPSPPVPARLRSPASYLTTHVPPVPSGVKRNRHVADSSLGNHAF